jgi:hypothetical protein
VDQHVLLIRARPELFSAMAGPKAGHFRLQKSGAVAGLFDRSLAATPVERDEGEDGEHDPAKLDRDPRPRV